MLGGAKEQGREMGAKGGQLQKFKLSEERYDNLLRLKVRECNSRIVLVNNRGN